MRFKARPGTALDIVAEICATDARPEWQRIVAARNIENPAGIPSDRQMLRHFCIAIAYSQGARSKQVAKLVKTVTFKKAFAEFDIARLAKINPATILSEFWTELSCIRFRRKVASAVICAQILLKITEEHRSFRHYLNSFQIPRRIRFASDVDLFWQQFDLLQADLRRRKMPFFRSTTSLLQLLLDLDYDSVKPDLIVMRLARRIGLINKETGDLNLRKVVRAIQIYSVKKQVRASVVDLQMLAFGGQSAAASLLNHRFCPPSDTCRNSTCKLYMKNLCFAAITGTH